MFKIMKCVVKSAEEFSSSIDSDRTGDHSLRVTKRVNTVVRSGSFTMRIVKA